jgi:hypothetical protein
MKNKNLLIGAGVVIVGYLLYKKIKRNAPPSAIPNSFVIKSDGYNTTYMKVNVGEDYKIIYSKISSRTDGSDSMARPTDITAKEFEDAYNKWLPVINNESVKKKK